MDVKYHSRVKTDLQQMTPDVRDRIRQKIEQLKQNPIDHEDSKLIRIKGRDIYRLEIKEERRGEIDHRAIYDIESGEIRIYGVIYREPGYPDEEIAERLESGGELSSEIRKWRDKRK